MSDIIASNIMSFAYGVMFTILACLWFRDRAEHKLRTKHREEQEELRTEHRKELDTLRGTRDAERDTLRSTPYILPSTTASIYRAAYNEVSLTGTLKRLKKDQELLAKRVEQLESERQSGVA
jgi:hypothetical protein